MDFDELMEKGNQLRKENKYEEALDAYQAALKADKRRTEAWNMKASTLGLLGQTDEAIECFDILTDHWNLTLKMSKPGS